jgi:hypothetical protein
MTTLAIAVALAAEGALAAGTVTFTLDAFAGGHHHKCRTGSGNEFPVNRPGGHCPPGLSKND